jgi:hypothetical protein
MLRVTKVADWKPAPFTILGWEVANVQEAADGLTRQGVHFERYGFLEQDKSGVWTSPNGSKMAWFKDPDGNVLSISQHS